MDRFAKKYILTTLGSLSNLKLWGNIRACVKEEFAAQKERLFLWSPVFLALGIAAYFMIPAEPPLPVGVFFTALAGGMFILVWPARETLRALYFTALFFSLFVSGFLAAQLRTSLIYTPMLVKSVGPVELEATIESIEYLEEGDGARLLLSDLRVERLLPEETPRLVRLRLRKEAGLSVGQRIRALAQLHPPSPPTAPGAFDFQRHAFFKGIGAVGFIYNPPDIVSEISLSDFKKGIEILRQRIMQRIQDIAPPESAGVIGALIVGNRKAIAEKDQEAMRGAGLAHMLAISGLHVGLASGFLFFMTRFVMALIPGFALHHPIKKYAALAALAGAFFYMLLAGASVPTQRAVMMTGTVLLAIILDRSAITLRLVAFAALVVLLIAPEALLSASFHMSFAAVAALVYFYDKIRSHWSSWHRKASLVRKIALYFVGVCLTSIIATFATAPFALFHFQQVAAYGLLANVMAMPLLAFMIMPCAVGALILMPLRLDFIPFFVMEKGVQAILDTAHFVSALPGATMSVPAWPISALGLLVTGFLFLMLWKGPLKVLGLLPIAFSLFQIYHFKQIDIYVSSSHELMAYRTSAGLFVSSFSKDKFTRESWERISGVGEGNAQKWAREGKSCGEEGCHIILKGKKIAFAYTPYTHSADCAWADILLSFEPLSVKPWECAAPIVIDKFDTWRYGAHGISIQNGQITVKRVNDTRGKRPWTGYTDRSQKTQ